MSFRPVVERGASFSSSGKLSEAAGVASLLSARLSASPWQGNGELAPLRGLIPAVARPLLQSSPILDATHQRKQEKTSCIASISQCFL